MNLNIKREELLISQLANLLKNDNHVAVGAASPIPGAAALLAKEEAKNFNKRLRVTILHSNKYNNFEPFFCNITLKLYMIKRKMYIKQIKNNT